MKKFNIDKLTNSQKALRRRILEISFKNSFSHLGSCLSAVDMIDGVYKTKKNDEPFILSNGHAGVALYAVLEKYGKIKDKKISENLHVHPDRNPSHDIHVSTGSLGQGLPIAVGMALANRQKPVYCMISDGESTEGSIWEALHFVSTVNLSNLIILINANGWSAYDMVNEKLLKKQLQGFCTRTISINGNSEKEIQTALRKKVKGLKVIFGNTSSNQLPFLSDLDAHYYTMTPDDYKQAMSALS